MAANVPKFGAWEGGENYTVFFDTARKTKKNGPMINPNDPQENPNMLPKEKIGEPQGKVPQFGAWNNGDNVGYTMYFDDVRKNKEEPSRKNKGSPPRVEVEPQLNRDTGATVQDPRVKLPHFGGWNGGEEGTVQYTAVFDNPRKKKTGGSGSVPVDPQLNRDVNARHGARQGDHMRNPSRGSIGSTVDSERNARQTHVGQSPLHHRGANPNQPKPNGRGGQLPEKVATIPAFGVWNEDPSKADGFTSTFARAKVDRLTPLHINAPPSYNNRNQSNRTQSKDEPKKGCWYACFG